MMDSQGPARAHAHGAHVGWCANGHADLREQHTGRRLGGHERLADTEVGDDGVAFMQQNVLRLDVAVDDVAPMRVVEGISDLDAMRTASSTDNGGPLERRSRKVCPALTGITKYK
jgi:hypothetical protein